MTFKILKATYGADAGSVDVTAAVRALAKPAGLAIPKVSNDGLGVGPMLPGVRKRLTVDYRATDGSVHRVQAWERKSLTITGTAA